MYFGIEMELYQGLYYKSTLNFGVSSMKSLLLAGIVALSLATGASAQSVNSTQVQDQSAAAVGSGNTIIQNASQTTVNRIRVRGRRVRPLRPVSRARIQNRQVQRQSAAAVGDLNLLIQSGSQRSVNY